MPWLVGGTRLQRGEDPHQPRLRSPLLENGLDLVFLAEVLPANVVDLQSMGLRQLFGIGSYGIGQRFGKLREIEYPDAAFAQVRRHSIGVTKHRQSSLHDHPVVARQHPRDLLGVSFSQQNQPHHPPRMNRTPFVALFGSGYAGLGSGGTIRNFQRGASLS